MLDRAWTKTKAWGEVVKKTYKMSFEERYGKTVEKRIFQCYYCRAQYMDYFLQGRCPTCKEKERELQGKKSKRPRLVATAEEVRQKKERDEILKEFRAFRKKNK